jgi:hypothetical protein
MGQTRASGSAQTRKRNPRALPGEARPGRGPALKPNGIHVQSLARGRIKKIDIYQRLSCLARVTSAVLALPS